MRPSVKGRLLSFEKYWMVTGCESSSSVKSFWFRSGRILPCLSRTVASRLTTFTLTETVGAEGSSAADEVLEPTPAAAIEAALAEAEEVCAVSCANELAVADSRSRMLADRKTRFEPKNILGCKSILNTMPENGRVHRKGL